ncbi:hypothetical protein ACFPJ1_40610 [Kribbella qitaiheensis]|uniref:hypothetical protein n=1 Tax=Kribbella qitaiheensis TaxID=1544730 RepID=UPI00360CCE5C
MTDPILAHRSKPGVFYLASESVEQGMRFQAGDGALYEIATEPTKWGVAWVADLLVIEGVRAGATVHQAMLYTGRRMDT